MALNPSEEFTYRQQVMYEIERELFNAQTRFPPFRSPHEGYAIIKEELDELWELIKKNQGESYTARREAIQLAAMAARYVYDLGAEFDA